MPPHPVIPVECQNCGGGDDVALIVAIASALLAAYAAVQAKRASDHAGEQLRMARVEHDEFLADIRARARLEPVVKFGERLDPDDTGVALVDGTGGQVTVALGLQNVGEKAATNVTVNVVLPAAARHAKWTLAEGQVDASVLGDALPTAERLDDGTGQLVEARYLSRTLRHVNRRSHYVCWVTFAPPWPVGADDEVRIPVKFKLEADELPDDEPEAVLERVLVLRRRPGG